MEGVLVVVCDLWTDFNSAIFPLILLYPYTCMWWRDNCSQWRHTHPAVVEQFTPYYSFILFMGVDSSFLSRILNGVCVW